MTDRPNNLFRIYLFICLFVYLFIYLFTYLMFLAFDNHSRLLPVVGRMHSNLYSWVRPRQARVAHLLAVN